jgi:hypothetical protein
MILTYQAGLRKPVAGHPEPALGDPAKPVVVVTESSEEFYGWAARARAGEVVIETVSVVPGWNAHWRLTLNWRNKRNPGTENPGH